MAEAMEASLYEHGVDAVFAGHVHAYERSYRSLGCAPVGSHMLESKGQNLMVLAAACVRGGHGPPQYCQAHNGTSAVVCRKGVAGAVCLCSEQPHGLRASRARV